MSLKRTIKKYASLICGGMVVAIDPSSGGTSLPGYAIYHRGQLHTSGVINLNTELPIQNRLSQLHYSLNDLKPDVLVIERIRGRMAHEYLKWSVGVAVAACNPKLLLECPVPVWKQYVGTNYTKSDESDAIAIGRAVIIMAGGMVL